MADLFSITIHIGHLYKVQLLEIIKMHFVFVFKKLYKAAIDPLSEQINIPPLFIIVEKTKK